MAIKIKFFASLKERTGQNNLEIPFVSGQSIQDIWAQVCDLPMPDNILIAINQEYADRDACLSDHDEIAFFPPVTGG